MTVNFCHGTLVGKAPHLLTTEREIAAAFSAGRDGALKGLIWTAPRIGKKSRTGRRQAPAAGGRATAVSAMQDSFPDFLARLRSGDDAAARELFERFAHQLISLARRRFTTGLRHKVDPEDVVQSAYKSFFARYGQGNLKVGSWDSLWGLLTLITLRKCSERVAYHRAARRDAARELSPPTGDAEVPWLEALSREPTPLEAAELSETVDGLLDSLDEKERPVLELSLQGYSTREISQRLGRAERTIRLLREGVRKRLERIQREGC
jgi:RNA polymerase sigma-70 factor (ECF subfamily)